MFFSMCFQLPFSGHLLKRPLIARYNREGVALTQNFFYDCKLECKTLAGELKASV